MVTSRIVGAILLLVFSGFDTACLSRGVTSQGRPVIVLAEWKGPIGPASTRYLQNALEEAREQSASALLFQLDTPGGLATSMREMISAILDAQVPVVGYVAPPGAHAASAGTYIIYATHIAAMAPGTNIGAATPVQIGGFPGLPPPKESPPDRKPDAESRERDGNKTASDKGGNESNASQPADASASKAVNDAVAFIRSLAELRDRNVKWAEAAVRTASSLSANQALQRRVIDIVADDVQSLLESLDGRTVVIKGNEITLRARDATLVRYEVTALTSLLALLTNPNVALILMLVGVYGLIFEFANPGTLGPGIIGTICLVLGLYALNQLPLDYAALALLLFGLAFMVAEAFTPAFGVLGIGGIVAFVIGAALLIDTDVPAFQLSWPVIVGTALVSGATLSVVLAYVWRSQRRPVRTGRAELKGARARVLDWSAGSGHVWLHGERWMARGPDTLEAGREVVVEQLDGLTVVVRYDAKLIP